jgi:hypothetical protein
MRTALRWLRTTSCVALCAAAFLSLGSSPAAAEETLYFPIRDNVKDKIVQYIKNETVRVDIAVWYLTQWEIRAALVNKFKSGVPVRVIGDRVSIFEIDPRTRAQFEELAKAGIPIRLRYHPTSFPSIMHWKCGIFVGQGVVEFGSANWTPFELMPASATDYKDETALITDDDTLVNPFKTKFDEFWANTTQFLDWPEAYQRETGQPWTVPMTIDRTRLEPNYSSPSSMVWEQGTVLNSRMTSEINKETQGVDIVLYRLSVPNITDALIGRVNAGVPVRAIVEPTQYRQSSFPEYWLTGARVDQLWVAGVQIKERLHAGLTHMKVLITSEIGMQGSSNFTKNWQRDHNYFIPAAQKPWLYGPLRDEFTRMWNDTVNYKDFYPKKPSTPTLVSPGNAALNQSLTPILRWNRAPWAVAYDVYLGKSGSAMTLQARVNATLSESPPTTYTWTPPAALQPNTKYSWRVVARTFATAVDASLIAASSTRTFTTTGSGGGGPASTPFTGTPVALPGTIQAENFDNGGQGVAYSDLTSGNSGGVYRTTDVDIASATDTGGGHALTSVSAGEWLNYSVNVASAGTYDIEARVASAGTGGTFHIEVGGVNKTGTMSVPNTGGGDTWTTIRKTGVSLAAGQQIWKVAMDSNGAGTGAVGNVNYIRVVAADSTPQEVPEIVIYASDVAAANLHGNWTLTNDASAAAGRKLASANLGAGQLNAPLAVPADYFDVTFNAQAGVRYRLWIRMSALNANKFNDAVWAQFTGSVNSSGTAKHRIGTSQGLLVNMATCSDCVPQGWGWQNRAYWLSDTGDVWFATTGSQTMRIQIREDGVAIDQIVLSPDEYLSAAPGPPTNDSTIVPKPATGGAVSTPFGGAPVLVPGTIQAQNFDEGDQGVAYFDLTNGNSGGLYRSTDVDIAAANDTGGGYTLGWVGAGEWLNYTVKVASAGDYEVEARVASSGAGGTFHMEVGGVDKTGVITVPNTGGWQRWTTIRRTGVDLSAGEQIVRVVMDTNGAGTGAVGNINFLRIAPSGTSSPPTADEIVIYADDVSVANVHGNWAFADDSTAAAGRKLASADLGGSQLNSPLAVPAHYFDVTFNAQAGVPYRLWQRMSALNANKFNDAVWVQFTGSVNASGGPTYRIGTTEGLLVNMATCSSCAPRGWGWHNRAYWTSDTGTIRFADAGSQTMRIQIREDGVAIDQIVLSPEDYLSAAPGPTTDDSTIVAKS